MIHNIDRALDEIITAHGWSTEVGGDCSWTATSDGPVGNDNGAARNHDGDRVPSWEADQYGVSELTHDMDAMDLDDVDAVDLGGDPMDVDDADFSEDVDMVDVDGGPSHGLSLDTTHINSPQGLGCQSSSSASTPNSGSCWSPTAPSPTDTTVSSSSTKPPEQPEEDVVDQLKRWAQAVIEAPIDPEFRERLVQLRASGSDGWLDSVLCIEEALNNGAYCSDLLGKPELAQAYRLKLEELVLLRGKARMGMSTAFAELAERWRGDNGSKVY